MLRKPTAVALLMASTTLFGAPIPDKLAAPAGEQKVSTLYVRGSQIYRCQATADPVQGEWVFQAPEGDLYTDAALTQLAGRHYDGPSWQALDGSVVIGRVKASDPGPDATSIAWLLLEGRAGNDKPGLLAGVTSVQRVDTRGGKLAETRCAAAQLGSTQRMPYTATYHFFRR